MKYLERIDIDITAFIKKNFFNKNINIKTLMIKNTWIEIEGSYSSYKIESNKQVINFNNINQIKDFIDSVNTDDFSNIKNYDFYYDFIVNEYIDFILKNNQKISEDELNEYKYKTSRNSYLYLLNNLEKVSKKEKETLEKNIFRNIEYKCKHAVNILKDRLPEYENELLRLKNLSSDDVFFYIKNVLIRLINSYKDYQDKTKVFEKFYKESELLREVLKDRIKENHYGFFGFKFQSEIIEDLILKENVGLIEYYLDIVFYENDNIPDVYSVYLKNLVKKINKIPRAIYLYYGNKKQALKKPENKKVRETLLSDPKNFFSFLNNFYSDLSLEEIEVLFPGYKEKIAKEDDPYIIKDFFSFLQYKFFHKNHDIDPRADRELLSKFKKYLYDNHFQLIKHISKEPIYSYYFAQMIGSTFKEGEPAIFNNKDARMTYLFFLRDSLGPELVPNYDQYDFSELDDFNEEYDNDEEILEP